MGENRNIRTIAVVGGGTAGWSAAALFARMFGADGGVRVTLVESSDIPTVGVGEATIPPIFEFLEHLGIDSVDFIRRTQATFKLAIRFEDWLHPGHRYWHPFGVFGVTIERRPFFHYWWRAQAEAAAAGDLAAFSPAIALAEAHKFALPPKDGAFPGGGLAYAMHFDAGLVATYLREYAEARGVTRLDRRVASASLDDRGHIAALHFDNGESLSADLYIDCSGFRGLLIEEALAAGYEDWSHWLPCDRAVAAPSPAVTNRAPYTVSAALPAGWRWRIPLQHRVGNGHVYASAFTSDADAEDALLGALGAAPLAEPRRLRFTAGHRRRFWVGNCVAIGLAAGFLEPLESTSIHLIHTGLNRLLDYFPDRDFAPALIDAYNRETQAEFAHIRDFLLLHYRPNQRIGEPFWDHVRNVAPPDSFTEKLALITEAGRIVQRKRELFADISWFFVAHGMGLRPAAHDPLTAIADPAEVGKVLGQLAEVMGRYQAAAPTHDAFLKALLDPALRNPPSFAPPKVASR